VKRIFLLITTITSTLLGSVHAGGFALSTHAGALGFGLEGTANIFTKINARFGYNTYRYNEGSRLDLEIKRQTATLLLDLYPINSTFRLSAGIAFNSDQVDLHNKSFAHSAAADDSAYSNISLNGKIELTPITPYLGIGWGDPFAEEKGWGFNIDLGVMLQGESTLELSSNSTPLNNLKKESSSTEEDLKMFDLSPVLSFGISYKF
jgi:hypothetical protein